jgi:hypothetical protein
MPRRRLVAVAALEAAAFAARLIHSGTASKTSAAPRSRRAQAARKLWTAAGSKYVSSPCAVTSTARAVDLVHPALVERRTRDRAPARRGGQQPVSQLGHLRHLDRQPPDAVVVDAPELRLEALAERDDLPAGMAGEEAPHLVVEAAHAQRLPLPEGAAAPKRSANG